MLGFMITVTAAGRTIMDGKNLKYDGIIDALKKMDEYTQMLPLSINISSVKNPDGIAEWKIKYLPLEDFARNRFRLKEYSLIDVNFDDYLDHPEDREYQYKLWTEDDEQKGRSGAYDGR